MGHGSRGTIDKVLYYLWFKVTLRNRLSNRKKQELNPQCKFVDILSECPAQKVQSPVKKRLFALMFKKCPFVILTMNLRTIYVDVCFKQFLTDSLLRSSGDQPHIACIQYCFRSKQNEQFPYFKQISILMSILVLKKLLFILKCMLY